MAVLSLRVQIAALVLCYRRALFPIGFAYSNLCY